MRPRAFWRLLSRNQDDTKQAQVNYLGLFRFWLVLSGGFVGSYSDLAKVVTCHHPWYTRNRSYKAKTTLKK